MTSLKIGIITYHFSDNFGALMQAYGLMKWLEDLGHEVDFINYHPSYVEDGGKFHNLFDPQKAKANAKILYLKMSSLQRRIFGKRAQTKAFEEFRSEALSVKGPRLLTLRDVEDFLAKKRPAYDFIVLGSDQIWAASMQRGLDPVYFGNFHVPAGTRRISYAPSFGRASVDGRYHSDLRRYLADLNGISVRERSGVAIVKDLTGKEAECVPDPTLLLGNFASAIDSAEATPAGHVFCYALRSGKGIREVAELACSSLKTQILSPYNIHRRWPEIGRTVFPSPKGWIALLDRSAFVVTNSFHGTVFSLLQRRPFLVVGLPGKRTSLNERALSLLDEVGLRHRFVENGDLATASARISEPVDWDAVVPKLAKLQAAGRTYLSRELSRAPS